jgi:hypothetical protein
MFDEKNAGGCNDPTFVEFHDARLKEFVILMDGRVVIYFNHIAVYCQVSHEKHDVWSYSAEITAFQVKKMIMEGISTKDDYVSDGRIVSADGKEIALVSLLQLCLVSEIHLDFGSGAVVRMHLSEADFRLKNPIKKFEEWIGPLG